MYCPKCGSLMEMINGELTCRRGNMGLAKYTYDRLKARFPATYERNGSIETVYDIKKWYCPGCGLPLEDSICPSCGKGLEGFYYELIERHPHLDEEGKYY